MSSRIIENPIFISVGIICLFISYFRLIWLIYQKINTYINKKNKNKMIKNNIIKIMHHPKLNPNSILTHEENSLSEETYINFVKTYSKIDKSIDIHIIINTFGGDLSFTEAICNCILNHKGSGKIIAYIPYYVYSAGFMISLTCDKIVMKNNAVIGPCDARISISASDDVSAASLIKSIDYKKERNEPIKENWLIRYNEALMCKERQKNYVNKLIDHYQFDKEFGNVIYEEFFSGKYNHCKTFSASELQKIGINIEIVEEFDDKIETIIREFDDEKNHP